MARRAITPAQFIEIMKAANAEELAEIRQLLGVPTIIYQPQPYPCPMPLPGPPTPPSYPYQPIYGPLIDCTPSITCVSTPNCS